MTCPRIGVTLGDPAGIGPEVVVKSLARLSSLPRGGYILFADPALVEDEERRLGLALGAREWRRGAPDQPGLFLAPVPGVPAVGVRRAATAENGAYSFRCFEAAVDEACRGRLDAVATAPVSKAAWALAGLPWRGHTDYLARRFPGAFMSFWSERLKVVLFTHHLPIREAVEAVRRDALADFIRTAWRALAGVPGGPYALLVAGLNPHAGEEGGLGREELEEIGPAVEAARLEGIPVSGPYPPDTVFRRALGRKEAVVVALFHDQGLIPFKLEAFATGVNATLGLPFARTSPDHGTAFDIAGRGAADPRSMEESIRLAAALSAIGS